MNARTQGPGLTWLSLGVAVAIPLVVGAAGGFATVSSVTDWYATLRRPTWTPPNAVFGPVWTLLYVMMGAASWLAWRRRPADVAGAGDAERAYAVQLGLNLAWSLAFFGLRAPALGLAVILALWVAILETMRRFYRRTPLAAGLLAPYLLWVTFATALNAAIWWLNRD